MECYVKKNVRSHEVNVVIGMTGSDFLQYLEDLTEALLRDCVCPIEKTGDYVTDLPIERWYRDWKMSIEVRNRADALYSLVGALVQGAGKGWIGTDTAMKAASALDAFQYCRKTYYSDLGQGRVAQHRIPIDELLRKYDDQNEALMSRYETQVAKVS